MADKTIEKDLKECGLDKKESEVSGFRDKVSHSALRNSVEVPMDAFKEDIIECVRKRESSIIIGETGSGKTTRVPSFLLEAFPSAKIAITQPRRVAVRSVSRFVASRRGEQIGNKIGYKVRFEDNTNEGTKVNFMTDGILLRKLGFDPLLKEYDIVMIDEAHERSLNMDFLMGLLKRANELRAKASLPKLKIIVASATIEKEKFLDYFEDSGLVEVPGRMYPVETFYEENPVYDTVNKALEKVKHICENEGKGDILVFMSGEDEIKKVCKGLEGISGVSVLPLYGALSPEEQDKVFQKSDKRKVIVATNIAETSITVDGVRFVVDSGYIKQKNFDSRTGIEVLRPVFHSKSGLEQRKGRAGRTAPGKCFRLFRKSDFENAEKYTLAEMLRSNLDHVVLLMKKMGISDVKDFNFIDSVDPQAIEKALKDLRNLSAIDENENITEIGKLMADLPLEPKISRMIVESRKYHNESRICTIAAMMSVGRSVFVRPKGQEYEADNAHRKFKIEGSDFLTMLEVYEKWKENNFDKNWAFDNFLNAKLLFEVREVRSQLINTLRRSGLKISDENGNDKELISKCILSVMANNLYYAGRRGSYYSISDASSIYIHPSSSSFHGGGNLIMATNIVATSKAYARTCAKVDAKWVYESLPNLCNVSSVSEQMAYYDHEKDKVYVRRDVSLKSVNIHLGQISEECHDPKVCASAFVYEVLSGKIKSAVLTENDEKFSLLEGYSLRTLGRVSVPSKEFFYREKLKGVTCLDEFNLVEDYIALDFEEYLNGLTIQDIEMNYPTEVVVRGFLLDVSYEMGESWEMRHKHLVNIVIKDFEALKNLQDTDFEGMFQQDVYVQFVFEEEEAEYVFDGKTLEELRTEVRNHYLEEEFSTFEQAEFSPIAYEYGMDFPIPENYGLSEILWKKDVFSEDAILYPAFKMLSSYDYEKGTYSYSFGLIYCFSEEQAKEMTENLKNEFEKHNSVHFKKYEKEVLLPKAQEIYKGLEERISFILSLYNGRSRSNCPLYMAFYSLYQEIYGQIFSWNPSPSDAILKMEKLSELMEEFPTEIGGVHDLLLRYVDSGRSSAVLLLKVSGGKILESNFPYSNYEKEESPEIIHLNSYYSLNVFGNTIKKSDKLDCEGVSLSDGDYFVLGGSEHILKITENMDLPFGVEVLENLSVEGFEKEDLSLRDRGEVGGRGVQENYGGKKKKSKGSNGQYDEGSSAGSSSGFTFADLLRGGIKKK